MDEGIMVVTKSTTVGVEPPTVGAVVRSLMWWQRPWKQITGNLAGNSGHGIDLPALHTVAMKARTRTQLMDD